MIIGFVGTPGSGKTYEAVQKIIDNLKDGKRVYTNIDGMDHDKCHEAIKSLCNFTDLQFRQQFHILPADKVTDFWRHCQKNSIIVLDEIHKVFSNRDWNTDKNKQFAEWASTHRHHGFDLVLITQDINKIDSHVRTLIEWVYKFRKMNFFGSAMQNKYLCFSYAGENTSGAPLQKNVRTYDRKIFLCYKSYAAEDIKELSIMTHVNILKHPVFMLLPLILGFTLYMFFFKSSFAKGDLFGTGEMIEQASASSQPTLPAMKENPHPPTVDFRNEGSQAPVGSMRPAVARHTQPITNTSRNREIQLLDLNHIRQDQHRINSYPTTQAQDDIIYRYTDYQGKPRYTTIFKEIPEGVQWRAMN